MVAVSKFLGQGLYTPSEVALYVRARPELVHRWLLGKGGDAVFQRQFSDEDRFVTFLDFVQTLAIAHIRRQFNISLQAIRRAVDEAKEKHRVSYPLAMPHRTVYFVKEEKGRRSIVTGEDSTPKVELLLRRDDDTLAQLTGKNRGNLVMNEIAEVYQRDLDFDPKTDLANLYRPYRLGGLEIRLDPSKRFGEPLTPSGYTAFSLADAVKQEGSIDRAAKAYGVDRTEVELACGYLDYLQLPRREHSSEAAI